MLAGLDPLAGLAQLASIGVESTATVVHIVALDSFAFREVGALSIIATTVMITSADSAAFSDGFRPSQHGGGSSSTVIDTFTGAAGTQLQDHTPDGGGSWDLFGGSFFGFYVNGACLTAAGRLRWNQVDFGTSTLYSWSVVPAAMDVAISASVYVASPSGQAVLCAYLDEGTGYYLSLVYAGDTGGLALNLLVGSGSTTLGSATVSWAVGSTHAMKLTTSGGMAYGYADGVLVIGPCEFDPSLLGTKLAIGFNVDGPDDTGSDSTLIHLDDVAIDGGSAPVTVTGVGPEFIMLTSRDAFAAWSAGSIVVTAAGPVLIFSGEAFGFGERASLAASTAAADAAGWRGTVGIASGLTAVDWTKFGDASSLLLAIAGLDAFALREASGSSASLTGWDMASVVSTASSLATLGGGDRFSAAGSGDWSELLADVPKSGRDRIAFLESAGVTVLIGDSEPFAASEAGATAVGISSADSGSMYGRAYAGLAPFPVLGSDAASFGDGFNLWGFPTVGESWAFEAVSLIVIGVASVDAFAFADSAYLSLFVTSCDAFAAFDAGAYAAFTATLNYRIYANDGEGGPIDYNSVIATTADLSWTSRPLAYPSDWWFGVRVFSLASGLEERNADAAVRVIIDADGVDVTARPAPPTSLRAVVLAGGMIRVEWSDKRPAGIGRATGYRVYQGEGSVDWSTPVADVPASQAYAGTFFAVLGPLTDGTVYAFGVRAYNDSAEEKNTASTTAAADATGPDAVGGFSIGLTSEA